MTTFALQIDDPVAIGLVVSENELQVSLADGRSILVPIAWFPRLLNASPEELANWRFIGEGRGIHWEDVDEDLSVLGLIRGIKAPTDSRTA